MAKYVLRVNGKAYFKDENHDVVEHYYNICKKYVNESELTITLELF